MPQIQDVMTQNCEWVSPETNLQEAAQKMKDMDCGCLPVGDQAQDKLIGMVTDRDIAMRAVADNLSAAAPVRDIMTPKVYYCYNDQPAEEVCNNMSEIKVRRLPVVNREKRLVGMVSMGDLAQAVQNAEAGETLRDITSELQQQKQAA